MSSWRATLETLNPPPPMFPLILRTAWATVTDSLKGL